MHCHYRTPTWSSRGVPGHQDTPRIAAYAVDSREITTNPTNASIKTHRSDYTKKEANRPNTESQPNRRRTDRRKDLDVEVAFQHLLQRAVFVFVRLCDQIEVSDIGLVERRRHGVAQHWSDSAVNPVARLDAI